MSVEWLNLLGKNSVSRLFPEGWICRIAIYFRVFLNLREEEVLLGFFFARLALFKVGKKNKVK